jgi:hypothetical protein
MVQPESCGDFSDIYHANRLHLSAIKISVSDYEKEEIDSLHLPKFMNRQNPP